MKTWDGVITSRKNPRIIETASLHEKKYRNQQGLFLIEGEKLVAEAAAQGLPLLRVFLSESKHGELLPRLLEHFEQDAYQNLEIITVSDECFSKISSEKAPQGVVAVLKHLDFFKRSTIIYIEDILSVADGPTLLLYGLQDPGNLGAVIRSAVAFGMKNILMSADCADLYNSKTVRAAMGCLFRVRATVVEDFSSLIVALRQAGRRVFAAELRPGAIPLSNVALSLRDCVIIGNEGHGIPEKLSAMCDASVYLPISPNAESLNAAVAASIFLWEQNKSNH